MALARADLEHLLRTRQLDRTLTTRLPPADPHDEYAVSATGITALDMPSAAQMKISPCNSGAGAFELRRMLDRSSGSP